MRIFVLVKQVPDSTEIKIDPRTGNLLRQGVAAIMNPEDRHALQAAVELAAQVGESSVTVLTMGPPQAIDVLTEALACGADKAVLLTDELFAGADTWSTSGVLARAIQHLGGAHLVLAGRQAIDGDTAQIGPQVAEALGMEQATYVQEIEYLDGELEVERRMGEHLERLCLPLPALVTVVAELNVPGHPRLDLLLLACQDRAPIEILNAADLGFKAQEVGLAGSLTEVVETFSPKSARETEFLEGSPAEMAAALLGRLKAAKLLHKGGLE